MDKSTSIENLISILLEEYKIQRLMDDFLLDELHTLYISYIQTNTEARTSNRARSDFCNVGVDILKQREKTCLPLSAL